MSMAAEPLPDLGKLQSDVQQAQEDYEAATTKKKEASCEQTSCLNRLNSAQKALDEGVKALKDQSPRDTDWKRPEREREMVPHIVEDT